MFKYEKLDVWKVSIEYADTVYRCAYVSSGRTLWFDESSAAICGVGVIEHRRGRGTGFQSRLHPIHSDRVWVINGINLTT